MNDHLIQFAKAYSRTDFDRIKFDWNGKHGDDFEDANMDFRMQLCEVLKDDLSLVSDALLIDLYGELSKSSKETWSVYNSYHLFANEILLRGGIDYFDIYVEGASKSMDTFMSSGVLNLPYSRIVEILNHIKSSLLEDEKTCKSKGYDSMLKRFEWQESQAKDRS